MPVPSKTVQPGELILVTGVSGYIGSHVADQALRAGYRVRGVVRNPIKDAWVKKAFDQKYGERKFELSHVPDMTANGALEEAVRGVSGIAHVATILPVPVTPEPYIPNVIKITLNVITAAKGEPTVKRIVCTSSSMAAANPAPDVERTITVDSWNEDVIRDAWKEPFDTTNVMNVYGASKTLCERAAWQWVQKELPHFDLAFILANTNFGPVVESHPVGFASTSNMLKHAFEGNIEAVLDDPPQYFVDVRDTARLHLAALIDLNVVNERIYAFAEPYNWNKVLAILRTSYPERSFPQDIQGLGSDIGIYPRDRAGSILRAFKNDGWTTLEQSILDTFTAVKLDQ